MKYLPKVSIIIPSKKINDYIKESIPKILDLDWPKFEIIIVIDKPVNNFHWPKTKIVASANVGPAKKRDLSLNYATGEILAFLDDDAYPETDWLKQAIIHFKNKKIAAVGGPAITPSHDSLIQKISGAVSESYFGGGGARNRFLSIGKSKEIDDWPTVNLLIRKTVFEKLGGFDTSYWPGEDTKLCLDIINAGYKIIYEPQAIVYHHRRTNLFSHLKQIGNYGLHRGFFVKKYPKTSFKLWYFMPSLFFLYIISLSVSIFILKLNILAIYYFPLIAYLIGLIFDSFVISLRWKNPFIGFATIPMIFFSHIYYGVRFISGIFSTKLKE